MIGPNSSTQCQNKSKHSISFDNIATLLPSFRSRPLGRLWDHKAVFQQDCMASRTDTAISWMDWIKIFFFLHHFTITMPSFKESHILMQKAAYCSPGSAPFFNKAENCYQSCAGWDEIPLIFKRTLSSFLAKFYDFVHSIPSTLKVFNCSSKLFGAGQFRVA